MDLAYASRTTSRRGRTLLRGLLLLLLLPGILVGTDEERKAAQKDVKTYSKEVRGGSDDPEDFYKLGVAYITLEQYEEAKDPITRYVAMKAEDPKGHFQMGLVQEGLGDCAAAVKAYDLAIEKDVSAEGKVKNVALGQKGDCLRSLGRNKEALAVYQSALDAGVKDTGILMGMANAYNALGKPAEARELYGKVTAIDPDNPTVHFNLGVALLTEVKKNYSADLYRQAAASFAKVAELDPKQSEAFYLAGECYLLADDADSAKPLLARYLELEPEGERSDQAREYLSYIP